MENINFIAWFVNNSRLAIFLNDPLQMHMQKHNIFVLLNDIKSGVMFVAA